MKLIPRRYQSISFYVLVAVVCLFTFIGNYLLYGYFQNQDQMNVAILLEQSAMLSASDIEKEILTNDFVLLSSHSALESTQIGDVYYAHGLGFLVPPVWLSKSYYFILVNTICIGLFVILMVYIKKQQKKLNKSVRLIKNSDDVLYSQRSHLTLRVVIFNSSS